MSNKIPICDRICKYYPADGLIYDIGQDGSKSHIPVIDPTPNTWHEKTQNVKQAKRDPEVSEEEHGKSTCFLTSKMLSMYFRRYGSAYRPEIMREIEGMGHEVGYHYEVLGKAKGEMEDLNRGIIF